MSKAIQKTTSNFFTENKDLMIVGGAIIVLAGAGFTWYYLKNRKENANTTGTPILKSKQGNWASTFTTPTKQLSINNDAIKFGSRHPNVKILQRYLKFYKEDLGNTGVNKDGIDGIFGAKTAKAAKNKLGKSSFSKSDIDGMRRALKTIGK